MIPQLIDVSDYDLTKKGLFISYDYQGLEKHLVADPMQSADLLQRADMIDDFKTCDGELVVKITFDYFDKERTTWLEWNEFVVYSTLSKRQAIDLVATHEKTMTAKQIFTIKKAI